MQGTQVNGSRGDAPHCGGATPERDGGARGQAPDRMRVLVTPPWPYSAHPNQIVIALRRRLPSITALAAYQSAHAIVLRNHIVIMSGYEGKLGRDSR